MGQTGLSCVAEAVIRNQAGSYRAHDYELLLPALSNTMAMAYLIAFFIVAG
jgi:hypothetical protein